MNEQNIKPWYRQKWPWLVMIPPVAAVVAGISTVIIANTDADSLVVGDFQKVGLVASRVTERDRAADRLGVGANIAIDHESGNITVRLRGEAQPETLELSLHHPTQRDMDRITLLKRDASGLYRGSIGSIGTHRWYLQLVDGGGEWRLTDELAANQQLIEFVPGEDGAR